MITTVPADSTPIEMKRVLAENRRQANVVIDVLTERFKQDQKWGANRRLPDLMWLGILAEEFGESAKEVLEHNDDLLYEEVTQVAAVAVAWMEALVAKKETGEEDPLDRQATSLHQESSLLRDS